MNLKNQGIVLIADYVDNHNICDIYSNDLECPSRSYYDSVYNSLTRLSSKVYTYREPKDFMDNIKLHRNDIVLSIWSGKNSQYRKALVPSICEAYGIRYVGADPYAHFISQDKHLSKIYCNEFNISSAQDVRIRCKDDFALLHTLDYPVIVKPNSEGGSNGISQENVVENVSRAIKLCENLLPNFQNDLLVEEYIPGVEITTVLVGTKPENLILKQNRIPLNSESQLDIWGFERKKRDRSETTLAPIDILDEQTRKTFADVFFSFKKAELMRIDGRIYNDKFYLIELTPDASLDPKRSVAAAFSQLHKSYDEMMETIILNTIDYYQLENANKKDTL